MNSNLLKLAFIGLSIICFSCTKTEETFTDTVNDVGDVISDDNTNNEEENVNEEPNDNETENTTTLTNCVTCPFLEITDGDGNVIPYPENKVCKGEDGMAYLDGVLNEFGYTYEEYLAERQKFQRCN